MIGDDAQVQGLVLAGLFIFLAFMVFRLILAPSRQSRGKHQGNYLRLVRDNSRNTGREFGSNKFGGHRFRSKNHGANMSDPKVQMEAVARAQFELQPILNKEEYRLLPLLESIVRDLKQGHRVTIQTSLGEVLTAKGLNRDDQRRAHASINSKRIDFGVIDRFGRLQLAIEYQGSGHYHDTSFMRDAVKREALRKAGVEMLEVKTEFSPEKVRADVLAHLAPFPGGNLVAKRFN